MSLNNELLDRRILIDVITIIYEGHEAPFSAQHRAVKDVDYSQLTALRQPTEIGKCHSRDKETRSISCFWQSEDLSRVLSRPRLEKVLDRAID